MSGYASQREVREVTVATLRMEGRDPAEYNVSGIMRDAFYNRGSHYGYGARDESTWRAAVARHCKKPGTVTVQWKHEDTINGQPVGPVTVIDRTLYDADPEIMKARATGAVGIPFGYEPAGVTDLGWKTRTEAQSIAVGYGVMLIQG